MSELVFSAFAEFVNTPQIRKVAPCKITLKQLLVKELKDVCVSR